MMVLNWKFKRKLALLYENAMCKIYQAYTVTEKVKDKINKTRLLLKFYTNSNLAL